MTESSRISVDQAEQRLEAVNWHGIGAGKVLNLAKSADRNEHSFYGSNTPADGYVSISREGNPLPADLSDTVLSFVGIQPEHIQGWLNHLDMEGPFLIETSFPELKVILSSYYQCKSISATVEYSLKSQPTTDPDYDDLDIRSFANDDYESFAETIPSERAQGLFKEIMPSSSANRLFVGFYSETPIVMCYALTSRFNRWPSLEVFGLFTAEPHRGKGFAKRIVDAVSRYALSVEPTVFYSVDLENIPSNAVAKGVGYSVQHTNYTYRLTINESVV